MDTKVNEWDVKTRKNVRSLAFWTGTWLVSMAICAFGPELIWNYNVLISSLSILVNTLIGIGMILINRRYIRQLDELHRKINMDAMALALGVGLVGGLSYSMLDITNVVPWDAEISHLVVLISITYLLAVVIGNFRYK